MKKILPFAEEYDRLSLQMNRIKSRQTLEWENPSGTKPP